MEIEINDFGGAPFCEHNYKCPVYSDKSAIRVVGHGYFTTSWEAQKEGWHVVKFDSWIEKIVFKLLFKGKWFHNNRPARGIKYKE